MSFGTGMSESRGLTLALTPHQQDFCADITTDFIAIIGGFGSGKTHAFCVKTVIMAGLNPGCEGAIAEPTNYLVRTRLIPAMRQCLEEMGIPYDFEKSDQIFRLHFKEGTTTIYCISGENWERIIGYNLAFFGSDETDTSNHETAKAMWLKAISRVRWGRVRQIYSTSTPEGFKWLHEFFVAQLLKHRDKGTGELEIIKGVALGTTEEYIREHRGWFVEEGVKRTTRSIHATSYENPLMDRGYIASMKGIYSPEQWRVWALGQFGNLLGLRVYQAFDRIKNHTPLTLEQLPRHTPLEIGMDFNVGKMAAIIHVEENGLPRAVMELTGIRDTPTMAAEIRRRWPNRHISVYPDASGDHEDSRASETDLAILRQNGFKVINKAANPKVRNRVNSMNAMFCSQADDGSDVRRYLVNTLTCPVYTNCLEQQTWVGGSPDKENDLDHAPDAGGYYIYSKWPLNGRPQIRTF